MVLCNTSESTTVQAKIKMSLEDWDKRRAVELGDEAGAWEVLYCSTGEVYKKPVLFFVPLRPSYSSLFFFFLGINSQLYYILRSKGDTPICTPRRSNASSQMRENGIKGRACAPADSDPLKTASF